jgi:hypothetical protein
MTIWRIFWAIYVLHSNSWHRAFKGQCHEIFGSGFRHGSVSPKPLIIPLGPFQIFQKVVEIFAAQDAPPASTTPVVANGKNPQSEKFSSFILNTFG